MVFSHQLVWQGDVAVIQCRGRLIAGDTEAVRSAALEAIKRTGRVVFQLSDVVYIDSTGLGLLAFLCVSARKRSGDVKLVAPSPQVAEVLDTTMLGRVFDVCASEQAALAAFAKASAGATPADKA